ncbi:WYL domain-containing protein [Treponema zuelzerae]|uniref:WYL domain-containing protein n=2 Tax=Teretinema zuelzerae TaxID=156 RepID=A0AAE3EGM9_9SPIR|nr:WYL domain-containing protein [Teretinema zuelzerae]
MSFRNNPTKSTLSRIYFIDSKIASGCYPNTKSLAREYETSTATISRDIEFMRNMLNAPIEYCASHRGFYYSRETYRLPAGFAESDDIQALAYAKTLLSIYEKTPIYTSVKKILTLISPIPDYASLDTRIIAPTPATYPINTDLWELIVSGLKENRILVFDYQSEWKKPFERRLVHPYQLVFDNGAWYLLGYAEERKGVRTFSLSRIKNIALTSTRFQLPDSWDYRSIHGNSFFGVFAGSESFHFKLKFLSEFALWVTERKWANDQQVTELPDGILLEFTSTQYGKVIEFLLSKGSYAYPLEPPQLVKDWEWHVKEMNTHISV